MSERFFVETPISGGRALIEGVEAHHLIHVMRLKAGQTVTLFDGSGLQYQGQITRLGRTEVEVDVVAQAEVDRELRTPVFLGVSLPKGDRQKWLIEKAVELGVTKVIPLRTERSVAQPVEQAIERLRRTVIEASKQCGRNRLMEIARPLDWRDYALESPHEGLHWIAHPSAAANGSVRHNVKRQNGLRHSPVRLAVGPEGGFTTAEVTLACDAGWQTIDLGPRILRIETAALLMVAAALHWGEG